MPGTFSRNPVRAAAALAAALLVLAAPALAAPAAAPEARASRGVLQLVAGWWADLASSLAHVFAANGPTIDPDGTPAAAASGDEPTAQPQHGPTIDPDG